MLFMRLHVSCQDHAHYTLAEEDPLIVIEVLHEVILRLLHQTYSSCRMPVFLNCLVVVAHGTLSGCVNMVRVRVPIVLNVMAHGCDDHGGTLQICELHHVHQLRLVNEHV